MTEKKNNQGTYSISKEIKEKKRFIEIKKRLKRSKEKRKMLTKCNA